MFHKDASHKTVLQQVMSLGFRTCSGIYQNGRFLSHTWINACQHRTIYSFDPSQDQPGAYHKRPCISSGNKYISGSFFDHIQSDHHGGIALSAYGFYRAVFHRDDFLRVDDMDLLTLISHFVQLCLDHILLTNDINIIFDQFCRLYGAFYHFMRGIISTHAV